MAKILVAGDFCPLNRVAEAFDKEDYALVLEEVPSLTSKADYSTVNFECPVVTGNATPIDKEGPNLKCGTSGAKAVKYAGFSCVTLANNHFLDFGCDGVKESIDAFDSLEIDHVGGGMNLGEASQILYKEIANQRIAIVNCCENEFSIATANSAGSNPLNPVQQFYAIKEARQNADRVLVIIHGGHEHFQLPSPRMVETYRFFIEAGADAVVNHHQHCFSGYEIYKGKPIFYGLGNLCFDLPQLNHGIWTEGYAVIIDFSTELPTFSIHPYRQCAERARVEMLSQSAYNERIQKLNEIIADPDKLQDSINKYYASCVDQYSSIFEPVRNRYYLGAKHRKWLPSFISKERKLIAANFIMCEAHRDKLLYYLLKQ